MQRNLLAVAIWISIVADQSAGFNFDYSQTGQHYWVKEYPQCAGFWQSPVIIAASRSVTLPLPALEMIGYHDFLSLPLIFKNNGHTVSVRVKHEFTHRRFPYIFGALLKENEEYELESFHFHWGLKNSRGSEHVLHGTRYPMEMHLIHRNTKYPNLENALRHEDGLTVLGVFFHLEEDDNNMLRPLISHLPEIKWANSETQLNQSLVLATLLPDDLQTYYTYRGSLTTPPCNEVVTWIVFASSVPISYKQMSKFRLLSNGKSVLADNYRGIQELGNRKIYVRRMHPYFLSKNQIDDLDLSTLKWYWT
ncbi:carbonic anhydrase 1 isoform X2 [Nasonia vitripennis]|uniref:Carbonic anhydrase n=1 Tax=Nasonia vitripennis TaxID=7425 RepID=A0A7M7PYZ2_NASVI|nr:carbonic anhydrase 1 isoform X2 [Nasonia vitripennis]